MKKNDYCYFFNSCLGNKYAGYRRFSSKTAQIQAKASYSSRLKLLYSGSIVFTSS